MHSEIAASGITSPTPSTAPQDGHARRQPGQGRYGTAFPVRIAGFTTQQSLPSAQSAIAAIVFPH